MAHVLHRSAPRRLKRVLRALALVAASLLLFGAAGARPAITVAVNGRTITVFDRTPLELAMRFAGVDVRHGVLYSAGGHRPLDPNYNEPRLFVDGAAALGSTLLRQGARIRAEVRRISGVQPAFFRAPGGSINDKVVRAAHVRGMRMLAWSADPRDFRGGSPAEIQRRVMEEVKPGSVILLHDGGGIRSDTVAPLPGLITQLRAAGYGFRTP